MSENNFKSFSEFLNESSKEITVCWAGGANPICSAYLQLIEATSKASGDGQYRIYIPLHESGLIDHKANIKYARKMFPRYARSIILDESVTNPQSMLAKLYNEGYTQINMVVPSDRKVEVQAITESLEGTTTRNGFFNFRGGVNVISAACKQPNASKLTEAAEQNDFQTFSKYLPEGFDEVKGMFNDIRESLGLKKTHNFRTHLQLSPVSQAREAYVAGDLFAAGDSVVIKETEEVASVIMLGSNYVLVETADGRKLRKWLDSVERIDESELPFMAPRMDRLLDRIFHNKKYKQGIKYYIHKVGDEGNRQALVKTAKETCMDFRNLEDVLHKMINKGLLPRSLATRPDLVAEESEVERVKQEKSGAERELEQEFADKLSDARRRDELEAEQERRRKEQEQEQEDEEQQEDENVKSFKQFALTETLKKVENPDGEMQWALVSKDNPSKVLQYYDGEGKPSDEWVKKVERRVQYFKHKG